MLAVLLAMLCALLVLRVPIGAAQPSSVRIYMSGMENWGEVNNLTLYYGDVAELTLKVEDAAGAPASGVVVEVKSRAGNGVIPTSVTTDVRGEARIELAASTLGGDVLEIAAGEGRRDLPMEIGDLTDPYGHETVRTTNPRALREIPGTLSWTVLADVEVNESADGSLRPVFGSSVREATVESVKVQGFMLPLENAERQRHFLLTANPPSCFFCLPGGPETVVEVMAREPVAFGLDAVVMDGRLQLLEDDDSGLLYRMTEAVPVRLE